LTVASFSSFRSLIRRPRQKNLLLGCIVAVLFIAVVILLTVNGSFPPMSLLSQSDVLNAHGQGEPSPAKAWSTKTSSNDTSKSLFFTELAWKQRSDGRFYAVLEFCSDGNKTYAYGPHRNCKPGQPSPLIRMKPKHHYHLTLVNNAHIDTNLHTHGLHVSGVGKKSEMTFSPAT
jgi:hypothetical protein